MIPGYIDLQEIFRGRSRVVYRGKREQDGQPVILKTVAQEFPTPTDLAGLTREYDILKDLRIAGVAEALALEKHPKMHVLVLKDTGGEPLRRLIDSYEGTALVSNGNTQGIDLLSFLDLAIQLS